MVVVRMVLVYGVRGWKAYTRIYGVEVIDGRTRVGGFVEILRGVWMGSEVVGRCG